MSGTLFTALLAFVPVLLLLGASLVVFLRSRNRASALQLFGALCLVFVVLAHLCEGLGVFPWMHWGSEHSAGHYLDLVSAFLGVTLFPAGYAICVLRNRQPAVKRP